MTFATPTLSIIIISYNTRQMTLQCLATLYEVIDHDGIEAEVWVVDNASKDDSVQAIRAAHPKVKIIANPHNAGFGAANNLAMKHAGGDYFLLLNSDAFPRPGSVRAMLNHAEAHGELGVVGPRLLNRDGSLQRSCWPFPSPGRAWVEAMGMHRLGPPGGRLDGYGRWPHDTPRRVDFVIGACMLVRREMYDRLGGFDERFLMYAEETDWQRRARDAGWGVGFTPTSEVVHFGGASGGAASAWVRTQFFDSQDRYTLKHHGRKGLAARRLAMTVSHGARAPLWALAWATRLGDRRRSGRKARLSAWLVWRTITRWRVHPEKTTP